MIAELQESLANVKQLRGLLPICAHCKKIRDDQGYWEQLESYLNRHAEVQFSHGICQDCLKNIIRISAMRTVTAGIPIPEVRECHDSENGAPVIRKGSPQNPDKSRKQLPGRFQHM